MPDLMAEYIAVVFTLQNTVNVTIEHHRYRHMKANMHANPDLVSEV